MSPGGRDAERHRCRGTAVAETLVALLGNGTDGPHGRPLHHPQYDFNDGAIRYGIDRWCQLVRARLAGWTGEVGRATHADRDPPPITRKLHGAPYRRAPDR